MNDKNTDPPVLAVDLGGTKILAALIDSQSRVIEKHFLLTLASEGPNAVIERILSAIDALLSKTPLSELHSISIASAGIIDSKRGAVTISPNLPGWENIGLRDIVQKKYNINTYLLNDANAAALSEHRLGAGQGFKNLIYMTISTGIGGGIIIDGKLYVGDCGGAGEIGHMIIKTDGPHCSCGSAGCLEALASGTAIARKAALRIKQGKSSLLSKTMGHNLSMITAEDVSIAASQGDSLAKEVTAEAAYYLGVGLSNLVNIFNPGIIVIGGGVSKMGDLILKPAIEVLMSKAFDLPGSAVNVVQAKLKDDIGILGAALYAREKKQ